MCALTIGCMRVKCGNYDGYGGCKYYGFDTIHETPLSHPYYRYHSDFDDPRKCPGYYEKKDCFMTSACVDFLGKADDCPELQAMRKFRDEKLLHMPGGEALVKEYYLVAPNIVKAIDSSKKKDRYYTDIYNTILMCMAAIDDKDDKKAVDLYLKMFNKYRIIFDL